MKTISELISAIKADNIQKEEIIHALSLVVGDWMDYRTEELFAKMYRLDILEQDIKVAFKTADIPKAIATLIYERQLQKKISRIENPATEAPDHLKW